MFTNLSASIKWDVLFPIPIILFYTLINESLPQKVEYRSDKRIYSFFNIKLL